MIAINLTDSIEEGEEREVVYSSYNNYLWIDSLNVIEE